MHTAVSKRKFQKPCAGLWRSWREEPSTVCMPSAVHETDTHAGGGFRPSREHSQCGCFGTCRPVDTPWRVAQGASVPQTGPWSPWSQLQYYPVLSNQLICMAAWHSSSPTCGADLDACCRVEVLQAGVRRTPGRNRVVAGASAQPCSGCQRPGTPSKLSRNTTLMIPRLHEVRTRSHSIIALWQVPLLPVHSRVLCLQSAATFPSQRWMSIQRLRRS